MKARLISFSCFFVHNCSGAAGAVTPRFFLRQFQNCLSGIPVSNCPCQLIFPCCLLHLLSWVVCCWWRLVHHLENQNHDWCCGWRSSKQVAKYRMSQTSCHHNFENDVGRLNFWTCLGHPGLLGPLGQRALFGQFGPLWTTLGDFGQKI